MSNRFLQKIKNPGSEFRGAPFWAWNSKLDPQELRWQIGKLHEMGLGGFFMHARVGLNTKYLGKEWFDCIRACIDEAKKYNMNAWLYDEDRWPSGAAGGIVTKNHAYRRRSLKYEQLDHTAYNDGDLAWFAAKINGDAANSPRRLKKGDVLFAGESFLRFYVETDQETSWYNDQTYLDTMNEDAVREFIKVTHEAYKREISADFGKTVPGIFSDEPNCSNWTDKLPQRFTEMYGYDLLDHLPELFFLVNGEKNSKVRLDYQNVRTSLFVNAFSKLIGEWCGKNNMQFTGHVLFEDTLCWQSDHVGAAMRFYEYMQAPGIDLLTEHSNIYVTAKQCVSMAHQFGRRTRLSETYGCTGWDFPFFGHKALGDWQTALGINLRCQHLAWYSMEAEAKRDYPASISYQSPWFDQYVQVENYFARIDAALSEGEEVRDLLIIHPIESTWFTKPLALMTDKEKREENTPLFYLTGEILKQNIDFDFGDEEVMSRHASVRSDLLSIAKADYKAVIIPELRTIRKTTLELLAKFADNGGLVVYTGKIPEYVDGVKSGLAEELYGKFKYAEVPELAKAVESKARRVSVTANGAQIDPLLYHFTKNDSIATLFLCNTSVNQEDLLDQLNVCLVRDRKLAFDDAEVAWDIPENWKIFEIDPNTGKVYAVASAYKNGTHCFKTSFPALGTRLFAASTENLANAERAEITVPLKNVLPMKDSGWDVRTDDPNVVVLDHPRYSVDGSFFTLPTYVIKVDDHLREMLGKRPRGGAMVQPWLQDPSRKPEKRLDLKLKYEFECEFLPSELFLGIERPDLYTFSLNGTAFDAKESGFWCDHSMKKIVLPANLLKQGRNELELSCRYHEYLPGLETIYLLGEFGVSQNCTITKKPAMLHAGDWCGQGFLNYAGNMTYRMSFRKPENAERMVLEIPAWRGVSLGVSVNGSAMTQIPWPPFSLDISELIKDGDNSLEITVFGHRRNSHGPFYLHEKWPGWTGPQEFKAYKETERQLVPCGLLEIPVIRF